MAIPGALLQSLQQVQGFHEDAFLQVHEAHQPPTSVRINLAKWNMQHAPFELVCKVPWSATGFYLKDRPAFSLHPWWHAGAYYVQEASSMAIELVFEQHMPFAKNDRLKVLDLCAAPGGKSTHILSMLRDTDVLVSNEVIGSRVNVLLENITRWGAANCIVTNNDPADFSKAENVFDAMVIDAPCSGSGLFRRDPDAISEWSEDAVMRCCHRQQRIIKDAWPALKEDGILVYTTCSYSPSENEEIADWIHETFACVPLALELPDECGIVQTSSAKHSHPCYRFFPNLVKGEGFFMAIFKKKDGESDASFSKNKMPPTLDIPVKKLLDEWVNETADLKFYKHKETLYAMPANTYELFLQLQKGLRIRKAGICLGQWMHNGLQPDHALAMSTLLHPNIGKVSLPLFEAQQYLRKENIVIVDERKGWMLATFENIALGWMKHLGNRTNNYYPKEWRLRK
jgi:NOL1/NOP2/sun family putative RNA methylase